MMTVMGICRQFTRVATLAVGLLCSAQVMSVSAQGFSAVVSPPRFEFSTAPGKTTRQVIEITHVSPQKGTYRVYTNDWKMGADGNAIFSDDLAPDSCRTWVALERREVTIGPNAKIRYRFEFTPPPEASSRECRFAVMIEGSEQVIKTDGAISFPVSGRVGVIVYAAIGDAAPKIDVKVDGTVVRDGMSVPLLQVSNSGNAHGRLSGNLQLQDASGKKIDVSPDPIPILPGQTRAVALLPNLPADTKVDILYPVTVKGAIEWGKSKTELNFRIESATPPPRVVMNTPQPSLLGRFARASVRQP